MMFENLKIKKIEYMIRYKPQMEKWVAKNRLNHIIGIQFSGNAVHYFNDRKFTISENCIYFLNQKEDYRVKMLEQTDALSIHFTTFEPIETDSFCIKLKDSSEISLLFEKFKRQYNLSKYSENRMVSYFYSICAKYDDIRRKSYFGSRKDFYLAKEYMDMHFKEKECLNNAVKICNISRRRFNDVFKSLFYTTPNKYITILKLDFAARLLVSENLSVTEIAELCGYSDIYYFSKAFKANYDVTPSEFRKRRLEGQ